MNVGSMAQLNLVMEWRPKNKEQTEASACSYWLVPSPERYRQTFRRCHLPACHQRGDTHLFSTSCAKDCE